jgi:serine/threonine-protein kinase
MHRHLKDELTPPDHLNPDISSGLAQIIEMMMAKVPGNRYRSAKELIEDLDLVSEGEAPRHARPIVDISSVVSTMHEAGSMGTLRPTIVERPAATNSSSALSMTVIAFLVLSVLLNAILIAVALNR